jgi:hypothetical protein
MTSYKDKFTDDIVLLPFMVSAMTTKLPGPIQRAPGG